MSPVVIPCNCLSALGLKLVVGSWKSDTVTVIAN